MESQNCLHAAGRIGLWSWSKFSAPVRQSDVQKDADLVTCMNVIRKIAALSLISIVLVVCGGLVALGLMSYGSGNETLWVGADSPASSAFVSVGHGPVQVFSDRDHEVIFRSGRLWPPLTSRLSLSIPGLQYRFAWWGRKSVWALSVAAPLVLITGVAGVAAVLTFTYRLRRHRGGATFREAS